ncbi:hypothetical protein [Agarivorans sp. 1_MG-2023]|uniref:hypothetical protein n=1 Tax=Agarivorans sp. 1_MG-2023 TaxID=3062634 RepID=UPI0026E45991|nr:hypothetical protein [Agarivorans sp. 1_MG-2023]MDO6762974.1 hypothetical protein [Agarivorans sp. 1_MG-2023]
MELNSLLDDITKPNILTLLPTYKCTARCKECCFCSSPELKDRIPKEVILETIRSTKASFPSLQLVVFSGGECFLLKDDLFECIALASDLGLSTRCVTNAYWGKNEAKAKQVASKLKHAGISEINISTGVEHSEWISIDTVLNASMALVEENIFVVVTIEKDVKGSNFTKAFRRNPKYIDIEFNPNFEAKSNSWMAFTDSPLDRGSLENKDNIKQKCDQLYKNIVVTPHRLVSSCCGLTFEYQPEMIIGNLDTEKIKDIYRSQSTDLLKMAISSIGPYELSKMVYGDNKEFIKKLSNSNHLCEVCLLFSREEKSKGRFLEKIKNANFKNMIINSFVINQKTKSSGILNEKSN